MGGRFERNERLEHQTLGVQRLAVRSEDYWDYKPEQRVQTIDGVTGVVKHVEDGPAPGYEEYEVVLDHGLGGGRYTASQLSPAPITTAAMEQTAVADYPELAQILVERPDPAMLHVTAAKGDNPFADNDDSDDDQDDSGSDDDSSEDDDSEGDNDSDGDDEDDGDDAPPWAKKTSKLFSHLVMTAATNADFRFHVTAAWRDVVEKAKRIRAEGRLRVTMASDGLVYGEVKGDHEVYETGLQRMPGKTAAHSWSCGCKWGAYHWGAPDDFSRFAGRMCSHALALQYEAQSRGMFGRDINVDERKPSWVPRKVVVRYDIDADRHRLAPATGKTAGYDMYGEWDGRDDDDEEHQSKAREWDDIHSGLDGIHRGLSVHLHPEDHAIIHDESRPVEERAHHLLKSLPRSLHGQEGSVGWHWTSDDGVAESFGETGSQNTALHHPSGQHWEGTSVVLHAHTPDREDINEHPDESAGHVYGYHDHGEREVPLHHGTSVNLKGISWKSMHDVHDHHGDLVEDHTDREYTRHVFPTGHHVNAFLRQPSAEPVLSVVARAAVAVGEDQEELLLALSAAGIRPVANANAPFGEPSGTSYVLPKAPGATQLRKEWENPASAGPLAGADPAGWNRQLPLQSYAGREEALFEPGGAEAALNDEPEGALPATDGTAITPSEAMDLTPSMTAGLRRQALKDFSLAEQQALINEGEGVRAANLDRLDIKGTHYADLEQVLAAQEDDTTWLA